MNSVRNLNQRLLTHSQNQLRHPVEPAAGLHKKNAMQALQLMLVRTNLTQGEIHRLLLHLVNPVQHAWNFGFLRFGVGAEADLVADLRDSCAHLTLADRAELRQFFKLSAIHLWTEAPAKTLAKVQRLVEYYMQQIHPREFGAYFAEPALAEHNLILRPNEMVKNSYLRTKPELDFARGKTDALELYQLIGLRLQTFAPAEQSRLTDLLLEFNQLVNISCRKASQIEVSATLLQRVAHSIVAELGLPREQLEQLAIHLLVCTIYANFHRNHGQGAKLLLKSLAVGTSALLGTALAPFLLVAGGEAPSYLAEGAVAGVYFGAGTGIVGGVVVGGLGGGLGGAAAGAAAGGLIGAVTGCAAGVMVGGGVYLASRVNQRINSGDSLSKFTTTAQRCLAFLQIPSVRISYRGSARRWLHPNPEHPIVDEVRRTFQIRSPADEVTALRNLLAMELTREELTEQNQLLLAKRGHEYQGLFNGEMIRIDLREPICMVSLVEINAGMPATEFCAIRGSAAIAVYQMISRSALRGCLDYVDPAIGLLNPSSRELLNEFCIINGRALLEWLRSAQEL